MNISPYEQAYYEGVQAYKDGKPMRPNPYRAIDDRWVPWQEGWLDQNHITMEKNFGKRRRS